MRYLKAFELLMIYYPLTEEHKKKREVQEMFFCSRFPFTCISVMPESQLMENARSLNQIYLQIKIK